MELKKTYKVDLENKKLIFLQIGLIISLISIFGIIEYIKQDIKQDTGNWISIPLRENEIVIQIDETPKPPLPKTKAINQIEITKNSEEKKDINIIIDAEASEKTKIEYFYSNQINGNNTTTNTFISAEDMPEFYGGEKALMEYIHKNLRYPTQALENKIQGKVIVSFVIDTTGKAIDMDVIRKINPELDKEAIRLVSNMPLWKPGKQYGKKVAVSYTIPIIFKMTK